MPTQIYFMIGVIAAFAIFAFAMSRSVKKYGLKMESMRKKKRRR